MTFDKWFAREGYDEQHRFVFGLAWNAGMDSASETNDRAEIAAKHERMSCPSCAGCVYALRTRRAI